MAPSRIRKTHPSNDSNKSTRQQSDRSVSPVRTPQRSPQRPAMRITAAQKQALIDNLQLEVTERARKLRAQYALQTQSLRTRIELRINRIPTALRKENLGDLSNKFEESQKEKQRATVAHEHSTEKPKAPTTQPQPVQETAHTKNRGKKRTSDTMDADDGERVKIHEDPIPNPKKRTKVTNHASSRQPPNPSTVLSPKSANSRTLPHSPVKPNLGSPQKPINSHPASPLKPIPSTGKSATAAATAALASMVGEKAKPGRPKAGTSKRAAARTTKREPHAAQETEGLRTISSTSNSSAMSTGTTIVRSTKKGPAANSRKAGGKKMVGATEAPTQARRVLRKRG